MFTHFQYFRYYSTPPEVVILIRKQILFTFCAMSACGHIPGVCMCSQSCFHCQDAVLISLKIGMWSLSNCMSMWMWQWVTTPTKKMFSLPKAVLSYLLYRDYHLYGPCVSIVQYILT